MPTTRRNPSSPLASPARRWMLALAATLATLALGPGEVRAQQLPDLQLQRFRPAGSPADFLSAYSTGVARPWKLSGAFYLDIADGPLRLTSTAERNNEVVASQLTGSLVANLGLPEGFEASLLVPGTLLQTSESLEPVLPAGSSATGGDLNPNALNDLRLSTKYQIQNLLSHRLGLAVIGNVSIPVGTHSAFATDRGISADLIAAAETWLWQGTRLGLNLGYRYRHRPVTIGPATMGDELLWSAATTIPLVIRRVDLVAELDGAISLGRDERPGGIQAGEAPTEARTAARVALTPDWAITFGVGGRLGNGVGVPDVRGLVGIGTHWVSGGHYSYDFDDDGVYGSADQCPRQPEDHDGYQDHDGCPDPDNDGDGVPDIDDRCPNTPDGAEVDNRGCVDDDLDGDGIPDDEDECPEDPEDFDGYQDEDGCPDPDNDDDGIPDLADECPDKPETFNDYKDEDGCPDEPGEQVRVSGEALVFNRNIHFETGKATLKSESHEALEELAGKINDHPELELIRVEGHTDNQGSKELNRDLSQRRAESVRNYLIDQGVSPERLAATGYGQSKPIASNDTAEGRARNRRVEFTILKRSDLED